MGYLTMFTIIQFISIVKLDVDIKMVEGYHCLWR